MFTSRQGHFCAIPENVHELGKLPPGHNHESAAAATGTSGRIRDQPKTEIRGRRRRLGAGGQGQRGQLGEELGRGG